MFGFLFNRSSPKDLIQQTDDDIGDINATSNISELKRYIRHLDKKNHQLQTRIVETESKYADFHAILLHYEQLLRGALHEKQQIVEQKQIVDLKCAQDEAEFERLLTKFNEIRSTVDGCQTNEAQLRKVVLDADKAVRNWMRKCHDLRNAADSKLALANKQIAKLMPNKEKKRYY